jgi:hypothetical protein
VLDTLVVECPTNVSGEIEFTGNFVDHEFFDDTRGFERRKICFKVNLFWC